MSFFNRREQEVIGNNFVALNFNIQQLDKGLVQLSKQLKRGIDNIMASLQERFDAVNVRLDEASSELTAELQRLRDALASSGVTLSPEAEASLVNIEAKASALADVLPAA